MCVCCKSSVINLISTKKLILLYNLKFEFLKEAILVDLKRHDNFMYMLLQPQVVFQSFPYRCSFLGKAPGLTHKHKTKLDRPSVDNYFRLWSSFVSYKGNKVLRIRFLDPEKSEKLSEKFFWSCSWKKNTKVFFRKKIFFERKFLAGNVDFWCKSYSCTWLKIFGKLERLSLPTTFILV